MSQYNFKWKARFLGMGFGVVLWSIFLCFAAASPQTANGTDAVSRNELREAMLAGAGKPSAHGDSLVVRFKEGGNVMWVLLILSGLFAVYTAERLMNLPRRISHLKAWP